MAKQLKLRRGTTAQHSTFTGAEGEVTVDTTKDTLVVHDGVTPGGKPVLSASAGAVGTNNLASNAVTTVKIADDSVTTAKIAAGAVGATELASSAVTTAKIADANVTTAKLADSNVTTAKLADGAVSAAKLLGTDWARSISDNGYQKLPGGLIIQWGRAVGISVGGGGTYTITFPITFPNGLGYGSVEVVAVSGSNLQRFEHDTDVPNLSYMTLINRDGDTAITQIRWMAIGW